MRHDNLKGIIFMLANVFSLAALYATMKTVISSSMSSNQAVFLYKTIILIAIIPWVFSSGGLNAIKTPNFALHVVRSFFSTAGTLCFMYALKFLKLVDITVLTHLEQMLWIVVGTIFFHEKFTVIKLLAIIIGFTGGFVVVKANAISLLNTSTSIVELSSYLLCNDSYGNKNAYIFVGFTIACWTINSSLVKLLGHKKATNKAQVFYAILFATIFSYCAAFLDWQEIDIANITLVYPASILPISNIELQWWQIGYISLASLFYLTHNILFFYSLKFGEMTAIAPFVYCKLLFSGVLGYIIFSEKPLAICYIGYAMIIAAGVLLTAAQYKQALKDRNDLKVT